MTDFAARGRAMHALAAELFPITRSLAGPGFRATLDRLEEVCGPLDRHRFATGEKVFDWTVGPEWELREATLTGPDGQVVSRAGDLRPGTLELGGIVIPGTGDEEVLFSTYCCHPSMANNELSGPVVVAELAALVAARASPPPHVPLPLVPETIGTIAYLSRFGERLRQRRPPAGWSPARAIPGRSRTSAHDGGASLPDRVTEHALAARRVPSGLVPFTPWAATSASTARPASTCRSAR